MAQSLSVKQLSIKTKSKIYKSCILPILLYGSETWPISVAQIRRLEKYQMGCLRWITDATRWKQQLQHISNQRIRDMCQVLSIEQQLHQRVLRWAGHVARMPNTRLPKQLLFAWHNEGQRRKDKRFSRYKVRLMEAMRDRELEPAIWLQIAQHRSIWRKLVNGTKYPQAVPPVPTAKTVQPRPARWVKHQSTARLTI